ncbi:hypothetical protein [Novipirellula artificiosorum]|uniref:Uncharacterized protein n=1 Tax=Novipirellula artificiosorum TaxID=2528016 RepID=A0A5C6E0G3_9BACT|nr:hypothetical protein [Novipirellula artificiosorum]TWU42398.1 hypothetical protein Poly41_06950 [Novipirellula artificiosorum]
MSPKHSIDFCPICGGGLCGVRICGLRRQDNQMASGGHGLIVCDECEAIWLEPDVSAPHQYPDACDARCPICNEPLWGAQSRWADADDLELLAWSRFVNHDLDVQTESFLDLDSSPDEGIV